MSADCGSEERGFILVGHPNDKHVLQKPASLLPSLSNQARMTKFRNPKLVEIEPAIAPPNTLGLRSVMFTVESVDDTVARLRANGAELVGEVAQYEDMYRLCYMRGPGGIIVALAEELF
jgi:hypothetical protein